VLAAGDGWFKGQYSIFMKRRNRLELEIEFLEMLRMLGEAWFIGIEH